MWYCSMSFLSRPFSVILCKLGAAQHVLFKKAQKLSYTSIMLSWALETNWGDISALHCTFYLLSMQHKLFIATQLLYYQCISKFIVQAFVINSNTKKNLDWSFPFSMLLKYLNFTKDMLFWKDAWRAPPGGLLVKDKLQIRNAPGPTQSMLKILE